MSRSLRELGFLGLGPGLLAAAFVAAEIAYARDGARVATLVAILLAITLLPPAVVGLWGWWRRDSGDHLASATWLVLLALGDAYLRISLTWPVIWLLAAGAALASARTIAPSEHRKWSAVLGVAALFVGVSAGSGAAALGLGLHAFLVAGAALWVAAAAWWPWAAWTPS